MVMNVLNQLAARDFKDRGEENPLLFALSDYLREAFQHIDDDVLSLDHESKILDSHLQLLAAASGAEIRLTVDIRPNSTLNVPPGCLTRIAACFMKAASPQLGGSWRMVVVVGGDSEVNGDISLTMELRSLAGPPLVREKDAQQSLTKLCNHKSNPLVLRFAKWSQDQPGHLRLVCSVPGSTHSRV